MLIMDTYNQLDVENNNAQTTGYTPTQATMSAFLLTDKKSHRVQYKQEKGNHICFDFFLFTNSIVKQTLWNMLKHTMFLNVS